MQPASRHPSSLQQSLPLLPIASSFATDEICGVSGTLDADEIRQLAKELKESNTAGGDDYISG